MHSCILSPSNELGQHQCTNGFTELALYNVSGRGQQNLGTFRLIPGMNFSCNGYVVWLRIAGRWRQSLSGQMYPKLQILRPNRMGEYDKTGSELSLNPSLRLCRGKAKWGKANNVYQCSLRRQAHVPFRRGDVVGIALPPRSNNKFLLYFKAHEGPINYIYVQGRGLFAEEMAQPQIVLQAVQSLQSRHCLHYKFLTNSLVDH